MNINCDIIFQNKQESGDFMEFKRYDDPNEFVKDNEKFILEKEWLNNLMAGNYKDAVEEGLTDDWLLARVTDAGKTELIILLRKPWRTLMYSPTNNKSEELYRFAAEKLYEVAPDLEGINTEKDISQIFANEFCKVAGKKPKVRFEMRILVLEKLNEASLRDDVIFRKAEVKDKPILKEYRRIFSEEALHETLTEEDLEKKFERHFEMGSYVLEKDGKIVATAVSNRHLSKGKSIGNVFTPKEERGKGYAYNIVYRLSKEFLDSGLEYCVLFTDDSNPISNHVYEKIGYVRRADTMEILFL